MAGRKLFTNNTSCSLAVKLAVRASAEPRSIAGVTEFSLDPGQSQWIEYGNHIDIYLNAIYVTATANGALIAQRHIVTARDSAIDAQLNQCNGVDFSYVDGQLRISTRQVG